MGSLIGKIIYNDLIKPNLTTDIVILLCCVFIALLCAAFLIVSNSRD